MHEIGIAAVVLTEKEFAHLLFDLGVELVKFLLHRPNLCNMFQESCLLSANHFLSFIIPEFF